MRGEKKMIYNRIAFQAAPFSYDLIFDDRITLVGGDSGTGKTVLYEMLEDLRLTEDYQAIRLFNYKTDDFSKSLMQCRNSFSPIEASSLSAAFRESELSAEDMEAIISINRIALNSEYMAELLKDGSFS